MPAQEKIFLSAEWRDLLPLNFVVDPRLLSSHIPAGTVLDTFEGKTYVSVVGFRFCNTKLLGSLTIPFHEKFRRNQFTFLRPAEKSEYRAQRGGIYRGNCSQMGGGGHGAPHLWRKLPHSFSMKHSIAEQNSHPRLEYSWKMKNKWCSLQANTEGALEFPQKGSVEEFITEHYWGYSSTRGGGCIEYHVGHAQWRMQRCTCSKFEGDTSAIYGKDLAQVLMRTPDSAFFAEGSSIIVHRGKNLL